jgi:hypothetical protein
MNPYLPNEELHSALLDKMLESGVKGGQNSDGSQKDGFLKYEKGKITAIYDINKKSYVPVAEIQEKCDKYLGKLPEKLKPWKSVVGAKDKEEIFISYFGELKGMTTAGASLAVNYLNRSKEIGLKLVADKVAFNEADVNTVLQTGFFHAYGPINNYLK